ncbi:MAG: radical SAM protein, partial [Candidatus Pacebacteria bacterium]|nr:radical SAM protein [Candidatus Paceibacterota bacterium]
IHILTKSDLVLRDIDLLKKIKKVNVNFTINTFDKKWQKLIEPSSPTIEKRIKAIKVLIKNKITVSVMMGPYWPFFTNPLVLFKEFKKIGIIHVFTESFNTVGENYKQVEEIIIKYYPELFSRFRQIFFNQNKFYDFYNNEKGKINQLSKEYRIPVTIYFGIGHAAKFN